MTRRTTEINAKTGQPYTFRDFHVYSANIASLANGVSDLATINIEASSDFKVYKMAMFADIAGAVQTNDSRVIPLITMQITDSGSSNQLFNEAVPMGVIMGAGGLPFNLPEPRIFTANGNASFNFTNYSAGTTYANIYVSLIGVRLYL